MKRDTLNHVWVGILGLGVVLIFGCTGLEIHDTSSLFNPEVKRSEVMGLVAGFGTTFAAVPDLVAMFKRRSSKGMNPTMAGIMAIFQLIWVYYGLLVGARPIVVWNTVAVAINCLSVGAYFHFARSERHPA